MGIKRALPPPAAEPLMFIVGPPDGSRPREVLADVEELESIKAFEEHDRNPGE